MPFTLSHAAAVLPLKRWCPRPLIFPALIFGSFAPDFGYFVHLWDLGAFSHTFIGSLIAAAPTALILLTVFLQARIALAALLPSPHQEFWTQWSGADFALTPKVVLSLYTSALIGSWTHIVWDSFTHSSGWCVLALPALSMPTISGAALPVYKVLQYASSLIGFLVLGSYYQRQIKAANIPTERVNQSKKFFSLLLLSVAALLISAVYTTFTASPRAFNMHADLLRLAFLFLVNSVSTFVMLLFLLAWVVRVREKKERIRK